MRLAALMKLPVVYILTHDSAYVGEDGPTHQPIEQTESLRLIPNLHVYRPADAEETAWSWVEAMSAGWPQCPGVNARPAYSGETKDWDFTRGGYILRPEGEDLALVLVAAGSEVSLAVDVAEKIEEEGFGVRVVSVPNREVYLSQDAMYRSKVIPADVPTLAIELGVGISWHAINPDGRVYVYDVNRFGASGPGPEVADYLGYNVEAIEKHIQSIIKK